MNQNLFKLFIIVNVLFCFLIVVFLAKQPKTTPKIPNFPENLEPPEIEPKIPEPKTPPKPEPEPPKPQIIEPQWINYPPIRSVNNLGIVLSDIESHMPAGHIYRDNDRITWSHETTHGINSNLRQKFQNGGVNWFENDKGIGIWKVVFNARINGFYCLNNKAAIITEPNTTISAVASNVPSSLRGGVFNLYLVQQAGSWNNTPLYIFDEWTAYTNGSAARYDLKIQERQETVQYMLEFDVYATCVAMTSKSSDSQLKSFLMWNLNRSMELYKQNKTIGDLSRTDAYWNKVKTASDANSFRQFAKTYFGEEWTLKTLGF